MARTTQRTAPVIAPQNAATPTSDTSPKFDLKSFFQAGVVLPKMKPGHHSATFVEASFVDDPDPKKTYVKMVWKFADRQITDNRFAVGFQVLVGQLMQQLGITEALPVPALFAILMQTPALDCWISYNQAANGQEYRNYNFLPPVHDSAEASEEDAF